MSYRAFSVILASSLALLACTQNISQSTQVLVNQPGLRTGFSALGGVSLDPTVEMYCNKQIIEGDKGYARSLQRQYRQYLNQLMSLTTGGRLGNSGSIYGGDVQPSGYPMTTPSWVPSSFPTAAPTSAPTTAPTAAPSTAPSAVATSDISVVEKTSFNGKIYDQNGNPVDGVSIKVRSLSTAVLYEETSTTAGGAYAFNNAPAGVQVEITVTKPGYAPRTRVEVLKSNKTGDPNANRYDFGTADGSSDFGVGYNGFSDLPEIIAVSPSRNATGIAADTKLMLTFSEPMDKPSVENALVIYKQGEAQAFLDSDDFEIEWNSDDTVVTFRFKAGVKLDGQQGYEIRFKPDTVIKDKSGTGRSTDYFKLTNGNYEAQSRFSVQHFMLQQLAAPSPEPTPLPPVTKSRDFYYFSYDDSASVAGVELTKHALENKQLPQQDWAKTWEFLNYESFDHIEQEQQGLFKISLGLWKHPHPYNPNVEAYEIGAHVTAPYQCLASRQNLNLTILLDVSGSMNEAAALSQAENGQVTSKIDLAKAGLKDMYASLKPGDIVNLMVFSNKASTELQRYVVGKETEAKYLSAVDAIKAEGGTNLQMALEEAYRQAEANVDSKKMNRLLLMTDAHPTEGNIDISLIRNKTAAGQAQGVYLSALGIGHTHNQALLNEITEAGRGGYFTIQSRADMREAIRDRFIPLMSVIARNVRFKLEFPGWLRHGKTAAEQVSTDPTKVQPTNFSANTSQYFWEQFLAYEQEYDSKQSVKLSISYQDPQTGEQEVVHFEKSLAEILDRDLSNIKAAHMIQLTTALIKQESSADQVDQELKTLLKDVGR